MTLTFINALLHVFGFGAVTHHSKVYVNAHIVQRKHTLFFFGSRLGIPLETWIHVMQSTNLG